MSSLSVDFGGALLTNCNVKIVIMGYLLQCSGVDVNNALLKPMIFFMSVSYRYDTNAIIFNFYLKIQCLVRV